MPSLKLRLPLRRRDGAPTLRERAAALKATAARIMRKPVAAPAPVEAAETSPDPIFAAMAKSRALQAAKDALYCGHLPDKAPEWGPFHEAYDEWAEHLDGVLKRTVPTTAAGCIALAQFTVDFCAAEGIPLSQKDGEQDNIEPLRLIAQSPALAGGQAEAVDWHSPPPGFMAMPALDPQGFANISRALPAEIERLHAIALAEFGRRTEGLRERLSEDGAREREAEIRRELGVTALTAAVDQDSAGALLLSTLDRAPPASEEAEAQAAVLVDAIEREWAAWSALGKRDYRDHSPQAEARCEASQSRRDALLDAADALPATSRAARHAKALASAWGEYVSTWEAEKDRSNHGLFGRLVLDIDAALSSGSEPAGADASAPIGPADPSPASPDAELLALGRRFEEAHAGWMALVPASNTAQARVEAYVKRAKAKGMEEVAAYRAAWLQDGVSEAHKAEVAAFEALEPLNSAIVALPAHTVAGLAVKARVSVAAVWTDGEFEVDRALGEGEDWERRSVRGLIDACTTLARREAIGAKPWDGPAVKDARDLDDGKVLFEDANGKLYRAPVEHWIAFTAQRLYGGAIRELNRQYNAQCGTDPEENSRLDSRIRGDLRLDALKDLAFRSDKVFQAAEARRRDGATRPLPEAEDLARLFDFQAMPVGELRTLFDHADTLMRVAHGLLAMPCSRSGNEVGAPNSAGTLPDWLSDACAAIWEGCVAEARRRGPKANHEDARLAILAVQSVANGDEDEMRAYARDLLALADRG